MCDNGGARALISDDYMAGSTISSYSKEGDSHRETCDHGSVRFTISFRGEFDRDTIS